MTTLRTMITRVAVVTVLIGAASAAGAQPVTEGQTEAVGFVGGVTDGGGATFGGGIHYAIGPRMLVVGELGYLTGGDDFQGGGVSVDSSAIAFNVNLHYLFPGSNAKFTPYVLGGLGVQRASASVSVLGSSASGSNTDLGLNLGGGARFQAGTNWGVRPEVRFYIADYNQAQFTVGLYYLFGK